jgi:hypothetical protein
MERLNDSVKGAVKFVDETKDSAAHATARAWSALVEGLHVAASLVTTLRGAGLSDALGWVGLQRRRSSVVPTLAGFGLGFFTGAAVGVLFAPEAGAETRRKIVEGTKRIVHDTDEGIAANVGEVDANASGTTNRGKHNGDVAKPRPVVGSSRPV